MTSINIVVLPGDGIGHEVTPPALEVIDSAILTAATKANETHIKTNYTTFQAGAQCYKDTGESLPAATLDACGKADAILLAAMGLPGIRYPDGREIAPQLELREKFELFAGVRPIKTCPGMKTPLADPRGKKLDIMLVRESTEGLFAARGKTVFTDDGNTANDTQVITRKGCERLFEFCFKLARERKAKGVGEGKVWCIDKANVLGSQVFFRKIFDEVGSQYTDISTGHYYVDAAALKLVTCPWMFDVMVMENMYGDILSDLGAGVMGGLGLAPSADIGPKVALFQPCHGTAPDIMGQGKANPSAMFLSAAMMCEWLGNSKNLPQLKTAATLIEQAVYSIYNSGQCVPFEAGGSCGTKLISDMVLNYLKDLRTGGLSTNVPQPVMSSDSSTTPLQGRVALITGAGSGIGAESARVLSRLGCNIAVVGIPERAITEVATTLPSAISIVCDVSDTNQIQAAVDKTLQKFGRIDICITSAGVQLHSQDREFHQLDEGIWDKVNAINVKGSTMTVQKCLASMLNNTDKHVYNPRIICIGSITGFSGANHNVTYMSGKGAIHQFAQYVAVHYGARGIRCNAVVPGALEQTPNFDEHPNPDGRKAAFLPKIPCGRFGTNADIANAVRFLCLPESNWVTGSLVLVDGGTTATSWGAPTPAQ